MSDGQLRWADDGPSSASIGSTANTMSAARRSKERSRCRCASTNWLGIGTRLRVFAKPAHARSPVSEWTAAARLGAFRAPCFRAERRRGASSEAAAARVARRAPTRAPTFCKALDAARQAQRGGTRCAARTKRPPGEPARRANENRPRRRLPAQPPIELRNRKRGRRPHALARSANVDFGIPRYSAAARIDPCVASACSIAPRKIA